MRVILLALDAPIVLVVSKGWEPTVKHLIYWEFKYCICHLSDPLCRNYPKETCKMDLSYKILWLIDRGKLTEKGLKAFSRVYDLSSIQLPYLKWRTKPNNTCSMSSARTVFSAGKKCKPSNLVCINVMYNTSNRGLLQEKGGNPA